VSRRSELGLAVGVTLAAAVGLLVSTAGAWVAGTERRPPPLPDEAVALAAGEVAPGVRALGLVVLAAVPALLAARGRGRLLVGALLAVAGAGAALLAAAPLRDPVGAADGAVTSASATARPVLALAAGGAAALAGAVTVARGGRWPAMGRRYEAPGPSAAPAQRREGEPPQGPAPAEGAPPAQAPAPLDGAAAWDALDRGEDPTGR
jgi:uncharacterized membrane protein (TIGR02234 family)